MKQYIIFLLLSRVLGRDGYSGWWKLCTDSIPLGYFHAEIKHVFYLRLNQVICRCARGHAWWTSTMNPGSKSWPARVATSRAFRGRPIGHADGLDRAIRGHFTKNPFNFSEINPRSRGPLRIFFKKHLRLFPNQPAVQNGWALFFFAKKTFTLSKINPRSRNTLSNFCENLLRFFSNQNTCHLWLYLFFSKNK